MANFRLQMEGLDELREALRKLPEELATEAGDIVLAHAEAAKRETQSGYPQGPTGNLKAGVTIQRNRSKVSTQAVVRSRAKHANIFERGTKNRITDKGLSRGQMPEADVAKRMIPKVIRQRARMVEDLKDLVRRAGFEVT